jgi:predicted ArsR family transcriptional regulator
MPADSLRSTDRRLLEYMATHPPDYIPLVASRLGIHLRYANQRVTVLVERGLIRPVTNESIYTITDPGRSAIDKTDQERKAHSMRVDDRLPADD